MIGKHHIVIQNKKLKYEFDIRRNITILSGESATGKTTLIGLLSEYAEYGTRTGMLLQSDVPCVVYNRSINSWQDELSGCENSIIFIDEGHDFILSKEFASLIQKTSNYYVLITRESLPNLPYSISEIYGIRTSGKYNYPEQIYHEFYPIYPKMNYIKAKTDTILIVEDSKSGYQFFKKSLKDTEVLSAGGNSKIFETVNSITDSKHVCIIADGAAFGAFMEEMYLVYKSRGLMSMFFPESFEWLILKSGVVDFAYIKDILNHPEDYIDSSRYFSWEQFFTYILRKETHDDLFEYHKDSLAEYYTDGKNREMILDTIPDMIRVNLK